MDSYQTNWHICLLCQKETDEPLTSPSQSRRKDIGSGYRSLTDNLIRFNEIGKLPFPLIRLDEGHGVEHTMFANNAKYHQSCKLKYNNTKLQRAQKRSSNVDNDDVVSQSKRTRAQEMDRKQDGETCLFCGQNPKGEKLHQVATVEMEKRVRSWALLLQDAELIAKLSAGDMVAYEIKYHKNCQTSYYNRARQGNAELLQESDEMMACPAFGELVTYIEEACMMSETPTIFKLSDLTTIYSTRLEELGAHDDIKVHSTRLKEHLLQHFPDLKAENKGREVFLAFEDDIATMLAKACKIEDDTDQTNLARAANIVRHDIFGKSKTFSGFSKGCEKQSVPTLLLDLVTMILEGPTSKKHAEDSTTALTIAQLLKFNAVKHTTSITRHNIAQETPLPTYIGLMLHAQTRKKELVDRFNHLGLSISYDRVLRISAQMGNRLCQQYVRDQVVCPPNLRENVFTTAAVDNIDHNPSSNTAHGSFHGTAISLFQHPKHEGDGCPQNNTQIPEIEDQTGSKAVDCLPSFYVEVPPVPCNNIKSAPVPSSSVPTLKREGISKHIEEEYSWLRRTKDALDTDKENISWAAYHASNQASLNTMLTSSTLLPLFYENAHSVAMVKHSMDVVKGAVQKLNPSQTPVITYDQPLFALAKRVQWKWPEDYGEDKIVILPGGLHIEMAALRMVGDWLEGSGWVEALVKSEIATPGVADSFIRATHIARTRRVHQVTAAALYNLQHQAYDNLSELENDGENIEFESWCKEREKACPQFLYWSTVLKLELCVLIYVRSLRQASFEMYLDAVSELVSWFHALDLVNYARWIPVHLKDMAELQEKHPEVAESLNAGNFTVKKTDRAFSCIAIDQAHEQNNALIKGDGGAIGLTQNPQALRRWMVAGPEVARVIDEFHCHHNLGHVAGSSHHDQSPAVQAAFVQDVQSLVETFKELGNPFEEVGKDIVSLSSKEIIGPEAVEHVIHAEKIGKDKFEEFVGERLIDRSKSLDDTIKKNKLKPFRKPNSSKAEDKAKQQLTSLKKNVNLFARLYIGCQTRQGDMQEFFQHENEAFPPALSMDGQINVGKKSNLLSCLEELSQARDHAPAATNKIFDGAALVHMLKPGLASTFDDYARLVFLPFIESNSSNVLRIDLVWDTYLDNSLKNQVRAKRGHGVSRRVVGTSTIPGNWQSFLRVNTNKVELFDFLSNVLLESFDVAQTQLVIAKGDSVASKPPLQEISFVSPCTHEEADTRIMLHAAHSAKHGHNEILVRTVDTDVVILAVATAQLIEPNVKLWIAFGTGKNLRYLAAHELARCLGPKKSLALPMFHALTGCDVVSSFVGHGKKSAWKTWNAFPKLTDALLQVSSAPSHIPEDVMDTVEHFVILLYDRTSTSTSINQVRQKLFVRKNDVKQIPPTKAALKEHVKRAVFQGSHVWGQLLQATPTLPSPTDWGWIKGEDDTYKPNWTSLPEAAKACSELISCGCKKGCVKGCKCRKAELACTDLCSCGGQCK